jgi:hypothetical protein
MERTIIQCHRVVRHDATAAYDDDEYEENDEEDDEEDDEDDDEDDEEEEVWQVERPA